MFVPLLHSFWLFCCRCVICRLNCCGSGLFCDGLHRCSRRLATYPMYRAYNQTIRFSDVFGPLLGCKPFTCGCWPIQVNRDYQFIECYSVERFIGSDALCTQSDKTHRVHAVLCSVGVLDHLTCVCTIVTFVLVVLLS